MPSSCAPVGFTLLSAFDSSACTFTSFIAGFLPATIRCASADSCVRSGD
jgi:hypothetical protein